MGFVLSDLRKDARPGVRATDVDGMTRWDERNCTVLWRIVNGKIFIRV